MQNMIRKASSKFKARRKQLKLLQKTKNAKKCDQSYISGDFGLEAIPESRKRKQEKLKTKGNRKKVNEGGTSEKLQKTIVIKFISEQNHTAIGNRKILNG